MAGWFLGVCHVDSGREHRLLDGCSPLVREEGGVSGGRAYVVFCVFVRMQCLIGRFACWLVFVVCVVC